MPQKYVYREWHDQSLGFTSQISGIVSINDTVPEYLINYCSYAEKPIITP